MDGLGDTECIFQPSWVCDSMTQGSHSPTGEGLWRGPWGQHPVGRVGTRLPPFPAGCPELLVLKLCVSYQNLTSFFAFFFFVCLPHTFIAPVFSPASCFPTSSQTSYCRVTLITW